MIEQRQLAGGECTIEVEQFKTAGGANTASIKSEGWDADGTSFGKYQQDLANNGYPTVLQGFPEHFLVSKPSPNDDETPLQFQYLAQKWVSDSEQCFQGAYEGESRGIICAFDC
ncbi:hypothetical protein SLS62_009913 [Diatrype stigma]|uniref:Uncharacterized protein n=1 Tax=Diatrype stigma TaxID=117547 RepID=A0AAN9YJF3_9PEZI